MKGSQALGFQREIDKKEQLVGEWDFHNGCHFCGVFYKESLELSLRVINIYTKAKSTLSLL